MIEGDELLVDIFEISREFTRRRRL